MTIPLPPSPQSTPAHAPTRPRPEVRAAHLAHRVRGNGAPQDRYRLISSLILPSLTPQDLSNLVAPDHCILAAYPTWCDEAGMHKIVRAEACLDGTVANSDDEGCVFM